MATYSKILSLISGIPMTADLSLTSNIFAISNLQLLGSTSGTFTQKAFATTTSYTVIWPAAQAASSGYALLNDGSGNLSWAPAASPLVFTDSLVNTGGTITLVNDSATPGATKYYGTNGASVLGYYSFPASGITQLTGDVTAGPGSGSQVATLAATTNATLTTLSGLTTASALVTVGTITTGTWHGTVIGPTFGGTGQTAYTTGDTLYASATNTLSKLTIGSTGNVLTVSGGIPVWAPPATGGTVTSVSVVSTNGFAGTVATATTTPAITISTTLTTPVIAGNGTALIAATTTGTGSTVVLNTSPTLVTPALGTPSALVGTNITGTATAFTASNVTTNANLTGAITSVGNATTYSGINPIATGGTNGNTAATALSNLGIRSGSASISSGVSTVVVTYSTSLGTTSYSLICSILNTTDTNVQFQPITITAFSATGFTASVNSPTLSANYVLHYQAIINV